MGAGEESLTPVQPPWRLGGLRPDLNPVAGRDLDRLDAVVPRPDQGRKDDDAADQQQGKAGGAGHPAIFPSRDHPTLRTLRARGAPMRKAKKRPRCGYIRRHPRPEWTYFLATEAVTP